MEIEIQAMKTKREENELMHDVKQLIEDIRFLKNQNCVITERISKLEKESI